MILSFQMELTPNQIMICSCLNNNKIIIYCLIIDYFQIKEAVLAEAGAASEGALEEASEEIINFFE